MSLVAVTGAGGYVGGRLVTELLDQGTAVRALVHRQQSWLMCEQVQVELVAGDGADVRAALEGADVVVHLAGANEIAASAAPGRAMADTIRATQCIGAAAREAGVRRVVYLSTVRVYGEQIVPGAVLDEEVCPQPRHPYAIARLASEHVLASLADDTTELIVLRLTNSVGAPADPAVDRWTLVANDLCRQGVLTGRLVLRSSGAQWRDFVALKDVVQLTAACRGPVPPGTYNLAAGRSCRVLDLAEMVQHAVAEVTGDFPDLVAPEHVGETPVPYRVAVDRLMAASGHTTGTTLADAVLETVRFCADHREEL